MNFCLPCNQPQETRNPIQKVVNLHAFIQLSFPAHAIFCKRFSAPTPIMTDRFPFNGNLKDTARQFPQDSNTTSLFHILKII